MLSEKTDQLKCMDKGISALTNTLLRGSKLEKIKAKNQLPCSDCIFNGEDHLYPLCFEMLGTGSCPPQCLVIVLNQFSFGKIAKILYTELAINNQLVFIKDSHLNISLEDIRKLMKDDRIIVIIDLELDLPRENWVKQLENIPVKVFDFIRLSEEMSLEEGGK